MNKYWQHFKTITKHRHKVMKLCFKIGLYKQGLLHDLSKYSSIEFFTSAKYYQGTSSPIDAEKKDKGYSFAWLHHRGHNPHHWEYWVDNFEPKPIQTTGEFIPSIPSKYSKRQTIHYTKYISIPEPIEIPYNYLIEMICNMIAAGQTYLGDKWNKESPLEFYNKNKERMLLHDETRKQLEFLLEDMAKFGLHSFITRAKIRRKY